MVDSESGDLDTAALASLEDSSTNLVHSGMTVQESLDFLVKNQGERRTKAVPRARAPPPAPCARP